MATESAEISALQALVRRFAEADCCWFSSVRPDGRAHSVPIWHVWNRGCAYVITAPSAVKVANVRTNPAVVVTHPDPVNPVIIEGVAALAQEKMAELSPLYLAKYDWDPSGDAEYNVVIEVTPTKLMAWGAHGEGRWPGEHVQAVHLG